MIREMETNRKKWVVDELRKSRAKNVISTYSKMIISGQTDLNKLAQMYRPDSLVPIATLKRFLKQPEVIEEVDKRVDDILKRHGIDWNYTIKERKNILELAMEKGDLGNALRVIDHFEEHLLSR